LSGKVIVRETSVKHSAAACDLDLFTFHVLTTNELHAYADDNAYALSRNDI